MMPRDAYDEWVDAELFFGIYLSTVGMAILLLYLSVGTHTTTRERVVVYRTPFGCNAQDLLPEDKHRLVRVNTEFSNSAAAVRWINAQKCPIDYYFTWEPT